MQLFKKYKQTFLICLVNFIIYFSMSTISIFKPSFTLYFSAWNFETGLFSPYQLITYQFTHANFSHVYFNMLIFLLVSINLESKIDSPKIFYYYVIFGILAGLTHLLIDNQNLPLVGASGSVWGFTILYTLLTKSIIPRIFFFLLLSFEIYFALFKTQDLVAHWCHLGGALAGLLIYYLEKDTLIKQQN